jgi:hypothetical protein
MIRCFYHKAENVSFYYYYYYYYYYINVLFHSKRHIAALQHCHLPATTIPSAHNQATTITKLLTNFPILRQLCIMWLGIGTGARQALLWACWWTFGYNKQCGISCSAAELFGTQERLYPWSQLLRSGGTYGYHQLLRSGGTYGYHQLLRSGGTYRYHQLLRSGGTYGYHQLLRSGGTYRYHTDLTAYAATSHRNKHCAICVPDIRMSEWQKSQDAFYNQNKLPNFVIFCIHSHKTKHADRHTDTQHTVQSEIAADFGQKLEVWQICWTSLWQFWRHQPRQFYTKDKLTQ